MAAETAADQLEAEALDEPIEFEFDGETWELNPDFVPMDFYEQAESGRNVAALRIALGQAQYIKARRVLRSGPDIAAMMNAVAEAIGGGSVGESRASRRSSARTRKR